MRISSSAPHSLLLAGAFIGVLMLSAQRVRADGRNQPSAGLAADWPPRQ